MENRRYLDSSDIAQILDESDSDISIPGILDESFRCESTLTDDFESENEEDVAGVSEIDLLYIAKNKMQWSAAPLDRRVGTLAENIISIQPGPTRFAVSRCHDILSSFLLLFPPTLEKIIVENTNKYGRVKFGKKWKDLETSTLRAYIAVLILAGVYRGKNEDLHGLFDARFGRPIFRAIMTEDNFQMISRALRFDDTMARRQLQNSDKFAPIRDLWDRWEVSLSMFYNCHENVTIDEQLVAFRGRCSFKEYMPSKPAKYGLKF